MQFMREINRLVLGLVVLFSIVTLAAAYWAVIGPDTILKREDNPRLVEAEASILRGAIVDRDGNVLVDSKRLDNGQVKRDYLFPAMYSALGYYSLRYGASGAEGAFDATLSGSGSAGDIRLDAGEQPAASPAARRGCSTDIRPECAAENRRRDAGSARRGGGAERAGWRGAGDDQPADLRPEHARCRTGMSWSKQTGIRFSTGSCRGIINRAARWKRR